MARPGLGRSIRNGALTGLFVVLVCILIAVLTGWMPEQTDGQTLPQAVFETILGGFVLGGGIGGLAGAARYGLAKWTSNDDHAPVGENRRAWPADPWADPVDRCRESAEAVTRLLDRLPDSAAADWLARIAETMATKLADIETFADAGRAAVPVVDKQSAARAKAHPLYAQLEKSADEFAEVADQVGRLMVELHRLELEDVRVQLEVLTEQLPLLRREA